MYSKVEKDMRDTFGHNDQAKESIQLQIDQVLSQMIELKQNADQFENQLYLYF